VRARDLETAVRAVSFATTGGVLPGTLVATRVGTSDIFRSPSVTVPSSLTAKVSVEVTARCEDFGGNPRPATVTLELAPSSDPTKPVAEWLSPFEGALWPAAYASVDGAKSGVDLLLRIRVTDRDLDGTGQEIPGAFVNVMVRGPIDASATLATDWTPAALLSGAAGEWIYEAVWRVPNGVAAGVSLPFEVEVIDGGEPRRSPRLAPRVGGPVRLRSGDDLRRFRVGRPDARRNGNPSRLPARRHDAEPLPEGGGRSPFVRESSPLFRRRLVRRRRLGGNRPPDDPDVS
jgi:hypothetical protein